MANMLSPNHLITASHKQKLYTMSETLTATKATSNGPSQPNAVHRNRTGTTETSISRPIWHQMQNHLDRWKRTHQGNDTRRLETTQWPDRRRCRRSVQGEERRRLVRESGRLSLLATWSPAIPVTRSPQPFLSLLSPSFRDLSER